MNVQPRRQERLTAHNQLPVCSDCRLVQDGAFREAIKAASQDDTLRELLAERTTPAGVIADRMEELGLAYATKARKKGWKPPSGKVPSSVGARRHSCKEFTILRRSALRLTNRRKAKGKGG